MAISLLMFTHAKEELTLLQHCVTPCQLPRVKNKTKPQLPFRHVETETQADEGLTSNCSIGNWNQAKVVLGSCVLWELDLLSLGRLYPYRSVKLSSQQWLGILEMNLSRGPFFFFFPDEMVMSATQNLLHRSAVYDLGPNSFHVSQDSWDPWSLKTGSLSKNPAREDKSCFLLQACENKSHRAFWKPKHTWTWKWPDWTQWFTTLLLSPSTYKTSNT